MREIHSHGRDGEKVIDSNVLFSLSWLWFNPKVGEALEAYPKPRQRSTTFQSLSLAMLTTAPNPWLTPTTALFRAGFSPRDVLLGVSNSRS